MSERIINSTWWLTVMGMICLSAAATLLLGYRGVFDLLAGRFEAGGASVTISLFCGVGSWALCRYRNDLL
jgi:hypothetical protein